MSDLRITRLDPTDGAAVSAYQRPYLAAERAADPERPLYTEQDTVAVLTSAGPGWRYEAWTAWDGAEPVGSSLHTYSLVDNLTALRVLVWVHPDRWGTGVGDALVAHAEEQARADGRDLVEGTGALHGRAGEATAAFAARNGYRLVNTMVELVLRLPATHAVPEPDDGYHLRVVRGPVPADLAQGYCDVHNRLNLDAPQGDREVEATRRTPEVLAGQDDEITAQGRERLTVFALSPAGDVAGFTSGVVDPTGTSFAQWGTIVDAPHRGHRLGLRLKAAQAEALATGCPGVRTARTTNAAENEHMIAVNDALGYVVTGAEGLFQRRLSEPSRPSSRTSTGSCAQCRP